MSLREIRRNTMRSILTMLGIVIGVAAVITMTIIGEGATQSVKNDISALGDNMLIVSPGAARRGPVSSGSKSFTDADVSAIESQIGGIAAMAPAASRGATVVYGNLNVSTQVMGTTEGYVEVRGYKLAQGRLLNDVDVRSGTAVCVLGETVRKALFGTGDAIGTSLRVGKVTCTVVGVLAPKGSSAMGQDQDDVLLIPLRQFQRRMSGNRDIPTIYISVDDSRPTAAVKARIEALLRERRGIQRGSEDDFNVRDMAEIAATVSSATGALTALLGAIAAVSLLVGGIGIMNIMLVSVTERTREIGIRIAIGALGREVMLQFLTEAVVLSTLGGVIGIITGVAMGFGVTSLMKIPFVPTPGIIIISFAFSAIVGVAFGYLPARKAAKLSPIEALRHE
ncbi:MAG: ABC transporter permease [Polyangiaceae bacterium]|nr:ABC transporter permease [Polyangiaceae bacterium]MCW5792526.1 ABC transporter permease [Polyangiaceae bacterium]